MFSPSPTKDLPAASLKGHADKPLWPAPPFSLAGFGVLVDTHIGADMDDNQMPTVKWQPYPLAISKRYATLDTRHAS